MTHHRRYLILGAVLLAVLGAPASTPAAWAQSHFKTLHEFNGSFGGNSVEGGVILDQAGNLYGTASSGAAAGAGVVFEMTPQGNGKWLYTILHVFNGKDGGGPNRLALKSPAGGTWVQLRICAR